MDSDAEVEGLELAKLEDLDKESDEEDCDVRGNVTSELFQKIQQLETQNRKLELENLNLHKELAEFSIHSQVKLFDTKIREMACDCDVLILNESEETLSQRKAVQNELLSKCDTLASELDGFYSSFLSLNDSIKELKNKIEAIKLEPMSKCGICFEDIPQRQLDALYCGHLFCRECMKSYILNTSKYPLKCPIPNCGTEITAEYIQYFVPGNTDLQQRFATNSILGCLGASAVPCPSCGFMYEVDEGRRHVRCISCNSAFCAQCKIVWHSGVTCEELKATREKSDEFKELLQLSSTLGWKQCPTCRTVVSKSTGCNHMQCKCGAEFCYSCGLKLQLKHEGKCEVGCICVKTHYTEAHPMFSEDDLLTEK